MTGSFNPFGNRSANGRDPDEEPVVIRDKRRIDPETGAVRDGNWGGNNPFPPASNPADPTQAGQPITAQVTADSEDFAKLAADLAERTADLQRVTAEYANYRKRVLRDQEVLVTNAKAAMAGELLAVLDDVELAKTHGDLTGAFKAVAERLIGVLERLGLQGFGAQGDRFDPAHHEAVQFGTSTEVTAPTVTSVFRRGYSFKERPLRAAVVSVTGPEHEEDHVSTPNTPEALAADDEDRQADATARSGQESRQETAPDLNTDEKPAGNPPAAEDPA